MVNFTSRQELCIGSVYDSVYPPGIVAMWWQPWDAYFRIKTNLARGVSASGSERVRWKNKYEKKIKRKHWARVVRLVKCKFTCYVEKRGGEFRFSACVFGPACDKKANEMCAAIFRGLRPKEAVCPTTLTAFSRKQSRRRGRSCNRQRGLTLR